jgi:GDP-L-fucose synthase
MELNSKIYIAGHKGLVGSAIVRKLKQFGYTNIIAKTSKELDLRNQMGVNDFFMLNDIDYVFLAAAKVGGIKSNSLYKGEFIYDNLMIQTNIINAAKVNGIKKLLFLGSSCIYPKLCTQPIKEEYLLSGYLESSNDAYAIAKIAGIKMCQSYNQQYGTNFISVMPTNMFGIGDNYHPENSHVIPGLIRRFHDAKIASQKDVICWGDGTPMREFLYSDDLADACIWLMNNYNDSEIVNIGTGKDMTINQLTEIIKNVVYPEANIVFNNDVKLNGTPRKVLDTTKINTLGWFPKVSFEEGIKMAYNDFGNTNFHEILRKYKNYKEVKKYDN